MKKIIFEMTDPEEWEMEALLKCRENHLNIESLYDEVFRSTIKHGNELEAEWFERIWERVRYHFNR
jgi:hypothetical protein